MTLAKFYENVLVILGNAHIAPSSQASNHNFPTGLISQSIAKPVVSMSKTNVEIVSIIYTLSTVRIK